MRATVNPTPLRIGQLRALVSVAGRELGWIIPGVAHEVAHWQARAHAIPEAPLREDALLTLRRERLNTEGAALFAIVPRRREPELLRLLIAYQILLDYLDTISERPADDPLANGVQLHRALAEALDPGGPVSDYYRHHRWRDDGGYVRALVETCRLACRALPGYARVHALALKLGRAAAVQGYNHVADPRRRDEGLKAWARSTYADRRGATWFELTAASCSSLCTYALLALAADPDFDDRDMAGVYDAYFPWIAGASTLLDAFVDQADDAASGNHSYIAHYPSPEAAQERLCEIVFESARRARALRRGTRHALIATGMVAMYLSKDSAREPALRDDTAAILAAAGSLPRVQLPILRVMRRLHGLRSA
jgi:tetraprenyl-beta-curcumene synthase